MSDATSPADVSAQPPRRFHRLRIAVSAIFAVLTLVLLASWVTSYWWTVRIESNPRDEFSIAVYSSRGAATVYGLRTNIPWAVEIRAAPSLRDADTGIRRGAPAGFEFKTSSHSAQLRLPYWCLALLGATLAGTPWIPDRFSLRAILIATTLVAVVLGLICCAVR